MKFWPFILVSSLFAVQYVTSSFKGQLCNQMFEIASVMTYAFDHGCEARFPTLLDAINGELNYQHVFHRLNISPFPEGTEFENYNHDQITDAHIFAPIPYFPSRNVRIEGHCVSEKYFSRYKDQIQALFSPTEEMIKAIYEKYGDILCEKTVALHVRTFIPDHFNTICHTEPHLQWAKWFYFTSAMDRFPHDHHFLVFSDDIEWTKKNFPPTIKRVTFIENNPHFFDFYLMSLCDHQIVSPDSTFSWWAAWLNKKPYKIVIAPDRWWNMDHTDVIPDGWVKIPRYPGRLK